MAVALEFISFIAPISIIERKYPGGLERCMEESVYASWHDEFLFRTGAMNPSDIEYLVNEWRSMGFTATRKKRGETFWKDFCVVDGFGGVTLPCDWIEVCLEKSYAYMKGTEPGVVIYSREQNAKDLRGETNYDVIQLI
jgi:hypothetical protein